jgi:hypothetical protein
MRLFPRSQRHSAALTGALRLFASATMIQEIEFAPDSPLEEAGCSRSPRAYGELIGIDIAAG